MKTRTYEYAGPKLTASGLDGKTGLELLHAIISGAVAKPSMSATLGFDLVEASEGVARFRGVPSDFVYNPTASVHGGWAATLLDSCMGASVLSTCDAETAYTTSQLSIHLTRAITADTGPVIAEGKVIHRGGRIATAEGRLVDGKGRLLAHGTTTCAIFPRKG